MDTLATNPFNKTLTEVHARGLYEAFGR